MRVREVLALDMRTKASAKIMEKKMTSFDDFIDDHDASDCLTYPQFFLIV